MRLSAPRGGQTAAILASLTSTCRRHQIDPQRYFTQLLVNLPQTKMSDLPNWLPEQWKLGHTQRRAIPLPPPNLQTSPTDVNMWFTHRSRKMTRMATERRVPDLGRVSELVRHFEGEWAN